MKKTARYKKLWLFAAIAVLLGGCETPRPKIAEKLATSSDMQKQVISSPPFLITVYEKINNIGEPANLYIEGDGMAWINRNTPSPDPTPRDPVALRLASVDGSANVIYMARPCQYSKSGNSNTPCPRKYWTDARFAPEVITSMSKAIDKIKNRYGLKEFNIIGYSGGGAVAILLAAQREGILSIRTIAGNLDHKKFSEIHRISYLSKSLNPVDYASQVANIPQYHFIGANDNIVPHEIFESYLQASGNTECIKSKIVSDVSHNKGWKKAWRELLSMRPVCRNKNFPYTQ